MVQELQRGVKSQEKLIEKAKKGNRKALEQLLKEIYQQMYKTAFIYMKNEQDALDVVQEAAYKVTMKLGTLKENSYFKTWVIKILIRCALDMLENNKKDYAHQLEEELTEEETSKTESSQTIQQLTLAAAIQKLELKYQHVVVLYYFNDLSIKEIAAALMYSEGTIKYNLHEARKQLRKLLEGTEGYGAF